MRRLERDTSIFTKSPRKVRLRVSPDLGVRRLDNSLYRPPKPEASMPLSKYALRAVLVVSSVVGIGVFSYFAADTYYKEDGYGSRYGEVIAGKVDHWKVTDPYNSEEYIPVRKILSLDDDDIAAWTKVGQIIQTTGVRGPTYPSRYGLGNDGEGHGEWYFTSDRMPAFIRQKDGTFVQKTDEGGRPMEVSGFIAGNFLRPPTKAELEKMNNGQK